MKADRDRRTLLDWPAAAGTTGEILARLEARARRRRSRGRLAAAALGAAAALAAGLLALPRGSPPPGSAATATLRIVAPEVRVLPDGSRVELKRGAAIADDFSGSERRVFLRAGTAHFAVARNPARPFVVAAGPVRIRDIGTAFSVGLSPLGVTILVTEGRVSVWAGSGRRPVAFVGAGSGVVVRAAGGGVEPVAREELDDRLRWRVPRLEFSGMALGQVARAMNRFSVVQLRIGDPSLDGLQVSGVLRADKVDALVDLARADFGLRVERPDSRTIVLLPGR